MVQVHLGKNAGHGQRVVNVGLTRLAELAFMSLGAEVVGLADFVDLRLGQVGFQHFRQGINAECSGYPLIANGIVEATEHSETI